MQYQSLWLADILGEPTLGSKIDKDLTVDVAIVGGGFVGLWTAICILNEEPSLNVAIFDKGLIGQGASSLNGGLLMSWWPKVGRLSDIAGDEDGLWLADQSTQNILELRDFMAHEQVDAEISLGGWLWTNTAKAHTNAWQDIFDKSRELGRNKVFRELSSKEIALRSGSPKHLGGIYEEINGQVHPGRLAYGLARIAARRGVKLFSNSAVHSIMPGSPINLKVSQHEVKAKKVVIASNIAADGQPELKNLMVLVTSAVIATKRIPERLNKIGWTGGETVTDSQSRLNYYRTTQDARIVYGMGIANLSYKNRLTTKVLQNTEGIEEVKRNFHRVYPMLADVPIDYGWSGPIDRTYDGLPLIGQYPSCKDICYGIGWSGNGVGPSRLGGKILAGLALEQDNRWTQNRFVNRVGRKFPPEPLRFLFGSLVRQAIIRKDSAEISDKPVALADRILANLAPAGTEDKGKGRDYNA
ncbi:FAD-binding oxidoreductase [Amylibacter sp.]|nr:FAD-binding oxidoreductase [Amylibacter sp.]